MVKKSELLKKKWSDLSETEKAKFKDKSTFSGRRQSILQIERTTGTRSQRTEGKGPKGAMIALGADGRLGDKDIKFLAENYPGFKASDVRTFLGKKKNQDIKAPKSNIKTTIRRNRGGDTDIDTGIGTRNLGADTINRYHAVLLQCHDSKRCHTACVTMGTLYVIRQSCQPCGTF